MAMETSSSSSVKGQSFFPWFSLLLTLKVPGREIFLLAAVVEILDLPEVPEVDGADLGCLCTGLEWRWRLRQAVEQGQEEVAAALAALCPPHCWIWSGEAAEKTELRVKNRE